MDPSTTVDTIKLVATAGANICNIDTFTIVASCLTIGIAVCGILFSSFRNFKADIKAEMKDVRAEMKDLKDEMRSLNEHLEQKFAAQEQRFNAQFSAQEQRFNSMDERLFFALTGKKIEDALLEQQAKKRDTASHQPTSTT